MAEITAQIQEIRDWDTQTLVTVSAPRLPAFQPGQYCTGFLPGSGAYLPTQLVYNGAAPGSLTLSGEIPPAWRPGASLHLHGPLGRGFHLLPAARQVALICFRPAAASLYALMRQAIKQGASIVWCSALPPAGLPTVVEVLHLDDLPGVLAWADYAGVEIELSGQSSLPLLLGYRPGERLAPQMEVLLAGDFVCAGTAVCGVCAVHTRRGWKFGCQDGPVFEYADLEI